MKKDNSFSDIQTIVTLGPSSRDEDTLKKFKDKGVSFVRVNMSHSSLDELAYFIDLAKKVGLPFIIDTEGSQVRSGGLLTESISVAEGDEIRLCVDSALIDAKTIQLRPACVCDSLRMGDLIHIDFNDVILRVADISRFDEERIIITKVMSSGTIGANKAVIVDPVISQEISLPILTEKDCCAISMGLNADIEHVAISFVRSADCVAQVRELTQNKMKIISKIECLDALHNLAAIIDASDYLLLDRGDLSKEIPIEKVPVAQKIILREAQRKNVGVFVATNLLESMIYNKKPTRAEVHDIIATLADGACGLALAAETAIGNYPLACVNMLNAVVRQKNSLFEFQGVAKNDTACKRNIACEKEDDLREYLVNDERGSGLISPHGGILVDRTLKTTLSPECIASLPIIKISIDAQMDIEQIATGAFSPLEGFMGRDDFESVLDTMRLKNGIVWTIPIVLDVSEKEAERLTIGHDVALLTDDNVVMAILHLDDMYTYDVSAFCEKMYGTTRGDHPGVQRVRRMNPILLGGKITLVSRRDRTISDYELSPRQMRRLFRERGWTKIVGFHTRNVIHRCHEFIQMKALEDFCCDGVFVHPVIGRKKEGDFTAECIISSYELMMQRCYPKEKVLFATFGTFSRYAGPREAVFTALCRKNFGCSHFIVGRDHTGVKEFYHPTASQEICERFPDLGIQVIPFNNVFYSKKIKTYIHDTCENHYDEMDKGYVSGTAVRTMLEKGEIPPDWVVRTEVAQMLVERVRRGENLFVDSSDETCVDVGMLN